MSNCLSLSYFAAKVSRGVKPDPIGVSTIDTFFLPSALDLPSVAYDFFLGSFADLIGGSLTPSGFFFVGLV